MHLAETKKPHPATRSSSRRRGKEDDVVHGRRNHLLNQARGHGSALQSPALHPFSVHKTCAGVEAFGNTCHWAPCCVCAQWCTIPPLAAAFPRERLCGADRWSRDLAGLFNDLFVRGLHVTSSHHVRGHSYLFLSRKSKFGDAECVLQKIRARQRGVRYGP